MKTNLFNLIYCAGAVSRTTVMVLLSAIEYVVNALRQTSFPRFLKAIVLSFFFFITSNAFGHAASKPLIGNFQDQIGAGETTRLQGPEQEIRVHIFFTPALSQYFLTVESSSAEDVEITVTDANGRKVYGAKGSANKTYVFRQEPGQGTFYVVIKQGINIKTLTWLKQRPVIVSASY